MTPESCNKTNEASFMPTLPGKKNIEKKWTLNTEHNTMVVILDKMSFLWATDCIVILCFTCWLKLLQFILPDSVQKLSTDKDVNKHTIEMLVDAVHKGKKAVLAIVSGHCVDCMHVTASSSMVTVDATTPDDIAHAATAHMPSVRSCKKMKNPKTVNFVDRKPKEMKLWPWPTMKVWRSPLLKK